MDLASRLRCPQSSTGTFAARSVVHSHGYLCLTYTTHCSSGIFAYHIRSHPLPALLLLRCASRMMTWYPFSRSPLLPALYIQSTIHRSPVLPAPYIQKSISPQSSVTCVVYSTKQFYLRCIFNKASAVQCYLRHIFQKKTFLRSPVLPALYIEQSNSPQSKCYLRYVCNKAILRSPSVTCAT